METVFTLERTYKIPRSRIREELSAFLSLPGVLLPGKQALSDVLNLYAGSNLSFIDAYHVVMLPRWGLNRILSFDRGLDRAPGIRRFEP